MGLGIANNIGNNEEYTLGIPTLKSPTTCLDLDGAYDLYYWASGDPPIDEEKGFSLVACVKSDSISTYDTMVGWHYGSVDMKACCFTVGGSKFQFGVLQGDGSTWDDDGTGKQSSDSISNNTWYHLVGTAIWDSSSGWDVKFYINGSLQTGTWSTSGYASNGFTMPARMSIGAWDSDVSGLPPSEPRWAGRINMVACYQGILTSDQVTWLYNSGVPRSAAHIQTLVPSVYNRGQTVLSVRDLQAYWEFSGTASEAAGEQFSEYPATSYKLHPYNSGTYQSDYMGA